ncbi:phage baseplate assembly protein domain-containing protein [Aquibium oceanicum]|uniref:Bacteriophage Mu Gp45 N-terminal domain-containing protein n=1 Tax=Aquibium oceanicum TaxID=1670800 RepID=A0A1L3SPV8_9HYPH|nr:phage baseplate assembly protein [Aquibium oceanicum]APH71453.1 hypothetical protein BSQ44_08790 [Aquibium oceanicum]
MSGYRNQFVRVEVESARFEEGQLLVTGRGMAGERFEDRPWYEPHGFASHPQGGAVGTMLAPGGRRDQSFVMTAYDPGIRPEIEPGDTAIYGHGNLMRLHKDGAIFDFGSRTAVLTSGGWTINGDVTINGNVQLNGNMIATGSIVDGDGNNGA